MKYTIEQSELNMIKGLVRLALNDLEYSRWKQPSEEEKRDAFWRGVRTLNELVEKIEAIEKNSNNTFTLKCPRCGSKNICMEIPELERVYPYSGAITYTLKGKWIQDFDCSCKDCGFEGVGKQFDTERKED